MSNFKAISHVSFIVSDLEKSLEFYCNILGMKINKTRPSTSFDGAWLDINNEQQIHLLKLDNPDPLERPEHGGRDRHTAFIVDDISAIETKLESAHIMLTKSQSGRAAIFFRDPDGNTLEIMS